MKIEIKVPSLGESISEATIGQIFVKNGQQVAADAEVLELETDKVNQVLYAPQAGVIDIGVKSDETVKIGQVIGSLESLTEKVVKTEEGPKPDTLYHSQESTFPPVVVKDAEPIRKTKESFIAELSQSSPPHAMPFESQQGSEQPTSPKSGPSSSESETRKPLSKIRRVIAKRLVEAQQTTAMLTTFNEVDLSQVIHLRESHQEAFTKKYGTKLGFMSFFVEAVTSALKAFPNINSFIDGDDLVLRNYINIGVAVGTDKGTFVPVLRDCDKMSFGQIESAIALFAKKARDGRLAIEDLQGGGFTITNGGVYGSLLSTPILNPPQSAILGMHKIEKRPVVVDDQIVIRPMMYLALSYDHRIVDGKESVSFLVHVKKDLEDPTRLLLDV